MAGREEQIAFILNANVVIDYVDADRTIISLAALHLGVTCLPGPLLREVSDLGADECDQLGLRLPEPTLAQVQEASRDRGPLSFEDRLCMVVARDSGATCVTNDKALRKVCNEQGVPLLWGLQLMTRLVKAGHLTAAGAMSVAEAIHAANPLHITKRILGNFRRSVGG